MSTDNVFDTTSAIDARKIREFTLSPSFIAEFEGRQPNWGYDGMGYFVYKRTYSRPLPDGGTEEWWQTVRRVVEGVYTIQKIHCKNNALRWDDRKAQKSAQDMYRRIWEFKFTPPGRGLWAMGTDMVFSKGSAALNNCGFVSTADLDVDFAAPFCFLMDMSMLGVGVGGDTLGAGKVAINKPFTTSGTLVVEDSREGWVQAVRVMLNGMVGRTGLPKAIDTSKVRPLGTPLRGFGGIASGPGPLLDLIVGLGILLDKYEVVDMVRSENLVQIAVRDVPPSEIKTVSSTDIVDIFNYIGKCVVAGNVRRSAEIMFGSIDDDDFLSLKLDREALMDRRWASNNSIAASVGTDYTKIVPMIAENGEPGIIWLDNMRAFSRMSDPANHKDKLVAGSNPCSEQSLNSYELCCLSETFPSNHEDLQDYLRTLKVAYLYAKTVTLVPTHFPRTNEVLLRNRRIGLSMSGIQQARTKFGHNVFRDQFCDKGYKYVQQLDEKYSDWLCVRPSIKTTSVKPSGTVSLLAGATPGIHYAESEYYIRRVRVSETSEYAAAARMAGLKTEPCAYTPMTTVIEFPIKERDFSKSKKDASIWEQFMLAAEMQAYWADNQVSVTVTFNKDEVKDIAPCLSLFETRLKSVSLLPLSEHGYTQAPYEEIDEETYNTMKAAQTMSITDALSIVSSHEVDDKFCDGESCTI